MSGEEFAVHVARPQVRIGMIVLIVMASAIWTGVRHNWNLGVAILLAGGFAAFVGAFIFGKQLLRHADRGAVEVGWGGALRAASAALPFAFAVYVAFVAGLWRLISLVAHFSLVSLIAGAFYAYVGYRLAVWLVALTDIPSQLSSGRIVVTDSPFHQRQPRSAV